MPTAVVALHSVNLCDWLQKLEPIVAPTFAQRFVNIQIDCFQKLTFWCLLGLCSKAQPYFEQISRVLVQEEA